MCTTKPRGRGDAGVLHISWRQEWGEGHKLWATTLEGRLSLWLTTRRNLHATQQPAPHPYLFPRENVPQEGSNHTLQVFEAYHAQTAFVCVSLHMHHYLPLAFTSWHVLSISPRLCFPTHQRPHELTHKMWGDQRQLQGKAKTKQNRLDPRSKRCAWGTLFGALKHQNFCNDPRKGTF